MEVEAMNFASNDKVRRQLAKNKDYFSKVRKDFRRL